MFEGLEAELGGLTKKLEALDDEIAQWIDEAKLKDFAYKIVKRFELDLGDVFCLFISIQLEVVQRLRAKHAELRAEAINVGVKKEHAEKYLKEVQREFPRLVAYVQK